MTLVSKNAFIYLYEYDEANSAYLENRECLSARLYAGYLAITARIGKYKKAKPPS